MRGAADAYRLRRGAARDVIRLRENRAVNPKFLHNRKAIPVSLILTEPREGEIVGGENHW